MKHSKRRTTRIVRNALTVTSIIDFIIGLILTLGCAGAYDCDAETVVTKVCLVIAFVLIFCALGIVYLLESTSSKGEFNHGNY